MGNLFRNYLSNRSLFYNLFTEAAKNLVSMSDLLVATVNSDEADTRETFYKQIDKLENTGDDITHKIYLALNKVLFTPINRNSIPVLASCIDDVADAIHEVSGRIYLYNISEFISAIKEIALLIQKASIEIEKVVNLLGKANKEYVIIASCRQIKNYEHQSDQVYHHAIAELFINEKDPITLIKYREILFSLENAVNKCKNTTDALEAILINSH